MNSHISVHIVQWKYQRHELVRLAVCSLNVCFSSHCRGRLNELTLHHHQPVFPPQTVRGRKKEKDTEDGEDVRWTRGREWGWRNWENIRKNKHSSEKERQKLKAFSMFSSAHSHSFHHLLQFLYMQPKIATVYRVKLFKSRDPTFFALETPYQQEQLDGLGSDKVLLF